jgi:hypothetical protein
MPMSEAQRKAAGDRLRAAREKKQAERAAQAMAELLAEAAEEEAVFEESVPAEPAPRAQADLISQEDLAALIRQVQELQAQVSHSHAAAPSQFSAGGPLSVHMTGRGMVGTFEKYGVSAALYPDPTARLAAEPRLARFAFPINYELSFNVTTTSYETKDGINTREPKFTLELIKIVMDDETGEPTNGRYVLRTAVFHEDPQAALVVARENGLQVDEAHEAAFLNEMRYLRMRDWLIEAFYPARSTAKAARKQMSIGNRIVEFYEANGEDAQSIPYGTLKGKV